MMTVMFQWNGEHKEVMEYLLIDNQFSVTKPYNNKCKYPYQI